MSVTMVAPVVVNPLIASNIASAGDRPAPIRNGSAPNSPTPAHTIATVSVASRRDSVRAASSLRPSQYSTAAPSPVSRADNTIASLPPSSTARW